jgi:hypothetical protein
LTLQAVISGQYLSDTTKPYLAEYQFHRKTFFVESVLTVERLILALLYKPLIGQNISSDQYVIGLRVTDAAHPHSLPALRRKHVIGFFNRSGVAVHKQEISLIIVVDASAFVGCNLADSPR